MVPLFENFGDSLTLYHGTMPSKVNGIRNNGLKSPSFSAQWYMLSTDIESALYHSIMDSSKKAAVIEYSIPINQSDKWSGYPHLWPEYRRSNESSWYAPKLVIPPEYIVKVHYFTEDQYIKQKSEGF